MRKVYIIHGWAYGLEKWDQAVSLLKKAGYQPILLEVPGLTKDSDRVWTIEQYVQWLREELEHDSQPVVLLGHSNGGRIALNFAVKYPAKIKQLILLDTAGVYHNELKIRVKRSAFKVAAKAGKVVSKNQQLRSLLYRLAREKDYHDAPKNMQYTMANMLASDKVLPLDKISVPTTIIWGDSDSVTPVGDAYRLQSVFNDAPIHFIKEARHSPHHTHPEELVNILKKVIV